MTSRRRSRLRSASERTAWLVAGVVLAGLVAGVGLSQGWWSRGAAPPAARPAPVAPGGLTPVDDVALDTALRAALDRSAAIMKVTSQPRSAQQRGQVFRWTARTLEVKPRTSGAMLARVLKREIAPSGGQILLQTPTLIRVGFRRAGLELITHEVQLVPFVPSARVAIIFDDAGGDLAQLEAILALDRPVTVSVLPGLRFSREIALRAQEAGLDVLLHLPLEAQDEGRALGPGGITSTMSDEEIAQVVTADLQVVPGAVGINNHMGSKGTADERVMRVVLGVVKSRGLIFVDSVTSPNSVAGRLAAELQVPTAARAVFLDNRNQPDAIRVQMRLLISTALQRKEAVAIGHATRLTPRVLSEMLAEFDRQEIALVPVSVLVK